MRRDTLRRERLLVIGLLAVALAPQATRCQSHVESGSSAVIPLHAGQNAVDLLGTGRPGAIDVTDRENYNAHGHHLALFQVRAPRYADDPKSADEWQLVPFFASDTAAEEIFHTIEGADCILRDLRILRGTPGRPVTVVIAERALGRSYADSEAVQFQFYELRTNASGVVGYPSYYFERMRVVEAKRPYCDVDDAFDRELHLGRMGLVRWEGPR